MEEALASLYLPSFSVEMPRGGWTRATVSAPAPVWILAEHRPPQRRWGEGSEEEKDG